MQKDWNALLQTLENHSGSVRAVAFSPDGFTAGDNSFYLIGVGPLVNLPHPKKNFGQQSFNYSIMESSTSSPQSAKSQDADIIRKSRFFHAIDTRPDHVTVKDICEQEGIKPDRGKYWLKQRKRFDDVASRRRPRSGRP